VAERSQQRALTGDRKHTIFVDNVEQVADFDVAEHFDTTPELLLRRYNRPTLENLAHGPIVSSATLASRIFANTNSHVAAAASSTSTTTQDQLHQLQQWDFTADELDTLGVDSDTEVESGDDGGQDVSAKLALPVAERLERNIGKSLRKIQSLRKTQYANLETRMLRLEALKKIQKELQLKKALAV
jgi:hypothetical protein